MKVNKTLQNEDVGGHRLTSTAVCKLAGVMKSKILTTNWHSFSLRKVLNENVCGFEVGVN